ncbi:MAG: type I-C CRISPR-associated protein Cas8c/Csd1 [Clostridiales bacterium]|nr:type I-C CRISPR-associated protein Cas8c/Csd1 [Clostridiales bacterium]
MILQALASYYDQLAQQGRLERPGWLSVKVSYALRLNEEGQLMAVMDVREEKEQGKKKVMTPKSMTVPEPLKRTVGIQSNFLFDNAAYMLGIDSKGKPERSIQCFQACAALHQKLLHDVDEPFAKAILAFFQHWEPQKAAEHPLLAPLLKELSAANLVFRLGNTYAHEVPSIQHAWQNHYDASPEDDARQRCLVTGEVAEIARLHPSIKGVREAQSVGASLVGFNARAFESYGHDEEQGRNAPVSKKAAFAYGAALNHLLADRDHTLFFGDTTMVFWAETAETVYADAFAAFMGTSEVRDTALQLALERLSQGLEATWDRFPMQPDNRFFILGLAPNAARLSVRFFLQSSFGDLATHLIAHQKRLELQRPSYEKYETLSIYGMLRETVNPNASNKNASPQMTGDVLRSIMTDTPYPATLYQQTQLRIRSEHVISWGKASIIKAYLLKNLSQGNMKEIISEVAQVKLNEDTAYTPYVLGRLFAVLEGLQQAANPGINATIRDRYFNSACCTPQVVFPTLIRLSQAHLKKLDTGLSIHFQQQLQTLMGMMDESYPARLNLTDQGIFQLGYYHQTQKRYQKKEDNRDE